jgi:hypothetical protein
MVFPRVSPDDIRNATEISLKQEEGLSTIIIGSKRYARTILQIKVSWQILMVRIIQMCMAYEPVSLIGHKENEVRYGYSPI